MRNPARYFISTTLAVVYFTGQVVLGSATETNFWAERRRNADASQPHQPQQFAALPNQFLNQLPTVARALPLAPSTGFSTTPMAGLSQNLKNLIAAIPPGVGSIQDVYDAYDPYVPENNRKPPVVLIQDVHLNTEAQTNIAALLQELINQKQIGLVGVEGAFNAFDFAPFRKLSDKTKVTDFLNKNLLAAPSYVGITSPVEPPPFVGVDDQMHYNANLEALFEAREQKPRMQEQVRAMEQEIDNAKKYVFSAELNEVDGLRTAYRKGTIDFGPYVKKLAARASENDLVVEQFLSAYDMELNLDFPRVEAERKSVIEKLTKTLNEKEVSNLVAQSLAYRMGRIGFGAYYLGLKKLCEQKGIRLAQTPHFDNYIRYVLLSDGIKAEDLFDAVDRLEQNVIASLATTEEEKILVARSDQISLVDKLLEFSLTPKEWERYKSVIPAQAGIQVSNNSLNKVYSLDSRLRGNDELKPFERFYEEADARSHKMLENLSSQNATGAKAFVLGGFHSPQVAQLLREQKISYVIVSPKLTKVDDASGSAYLSVFAREKTPLEKLFSGQKLFLSPARESVGAAALFQPIEGAPHVVIEIKKADATGQELIGQTGIAAKLSKLFFSFLQGIWKFLSNLFSRFHSRSNVDDETMIAVKKYLVDETTSDDVLKKILSEHPEKLSALQAEAGVLQKFIQDKWPYDSRQMEAMDELTRLGILTSAQLPANYDATRIDPDLQFLVDNFGPRVGLTLARAITVDHFPLFEMIRKEQAIPALMKTFAAKFQISRGFRLRALTNALEQMEDLAWSTPLIETLQKTAQQPLNRHIQYQSWGKIDALTQLGLRQREPSPLLSDGFVGHGGQIKDQTRFSLYKTKGLLPQDQTGVSGADVSNTPDRVSLSTIILRAKRWAGSAINEWGLINNNRYRVTFIIDPVWARAHANEFHFTGSGFLNTSVDSRKVVEAYGLTENLRVFKEKHETAKGQFLVSGISDEMAVESLPAEAILGVVTSPFNAMRMAAWEREMRFQGRHPWQIWVLTSPTATAELLPFDLSEGSPIRSPQSTGK